MARRHRRRCLPRPAQGRARTRTPRGGLGEGPTLRHAADLAAHEGRSARCGVGGGRRPDAAAPAPSTSGPGGGAGGHSGDTLVRRRGRNTAGAPARRRRHLAGVAPGVAAAGALARGVRADPARPLWSRPPARWRRPIDRCARRRGRRAARSSRDRPGAHRRQLARRVDRPGAGPPRTGPVGGPVRPRRRVAVGGPHDRRRHRVAAVVRPARQASRPRGGDRPSAAGAATAARDAGRTSRPASTRPSSRPRSGR